MTDGQLIAAAHQGDADAWRTLYERWLPWVWRYACTLIRDTHAAEDITSEAMTAWVKRLEESGGDAPQLAAWLRTVVRNKAADHHRRTGRHRRALEDAASWVVQHDGDDDPGRGLVDCEDRNDVATALEQLPENYRLALEWKYGHSLSVGAIAERTGVTEKSVEAVLYRARKEFRRLYELRLAQQDHAPAPRPELAPANPASNSHPESKS